MKEEAFDLVLIKCFPTFYFYFLTLPTLTLYIIQINTFCAAPQFTQCQKQADVLSFPLTIKHLSSDWLLLMTSFKARTENNCLKQSVWNNLEPVSQALFVYK